MRAVQMLQNIASNKRKVQLLYIIGIAPSFLLISRTHAARHAVVMSAGSRLVEVGELVVRAEHVSDLVLVHLLHEVTSGTAVLTGIEFTRLFVEHLAHSSWLKFFFVERCASRC